MSAFVFACGAPHGGSVDSTLALARLVAVAGNEVDVVIADVDPYSRAPRATAAIVRLNRANRRLGAAVWRVHDALAPRGTVEMIDGVRVTRTADVPSAVRTIGTSGAVIVANSMRRLDLERLCAIGRRRSWTLVWYLREATSLAHAVDLGHRMHRVLANSRPLVAEYHRLTGFPCSYVPSVIDTDDLPEPDERSSIVLVNAVPSYGLREAVELARALPDHRVVLQESWPIEGRDLTRLVELIDGVENVEFRQRAPRSEVYRDAAIMIAPHSDSAVGLNRPRVALEAQHLGIPMIAHDLPGLRAVAASPELLVPVGGGIEEWVARVRLVEADARRYGIAARSFAASELWSADQVLSAFFDAIGRRTIDTNTVEIAAPLPRYSAVVATFERAAELLVSIRAMVAQSAPPAVIVVVDNSPDAGAGGTVQMALDAAVAGSRSRLVYVPTESNLGPAGGWAVGAQHISNDPDRGEWVMLIDDDDPLDETGVVETLLAVAARAPSNVVGVGHRGAVASRRTGLLQRVRPAPGATSEVDYLAGGGSPIYRWSAIDRWGFVDAALFFGFEDLDLGLRFRSQGLHLLAYQSPSGFEVADTSGRRTAWREYFKMRALVVVCRRHLGRTALAATLARAALFGAARLLLQPNGWAFVAARWAGVNDGLRDRLGPAGRAPTENPSKSMLRRGTATPQHQGRGDAR